MQRPESRIQNPENSKMATEVQNENKKTTDIQRTKNVERRQNNIECKCVIAYSIQHRAVGKQIQEMEKERNGQNYGLYPTKFSTRAQVVSSSGLYDMTPITICLYVHYSL